MKVARLTKVLTQRRLTTSGGSGARSHAKRARPFIAGRPLHVVLRARFGQPSMLRYERRIREFSARVGSKHDVRVDDYANAGDHIHLLVVPRNREGLSAFLRAIAGTIARIVLDARKGVKRLRGKRHFWAGRVFTRLMDWGRDYGCVKRYIRINRLELSAEANREQARRILGRIEALEDELRRGAIASLRIVGFRGT